MSKESHDGDATEGGLAEPGTSRHFIDGDEVPRGRFDETLAGLAIDAVPERGGWLVEPDGEYAGSEARFQARNPETGARYRLEVVEHRAAGAVPHVTRTLTSEPPELLRRVIEEGLWGAERLTVLRDGEASFDFEPVEPHVRSREHHMGVLPGAILARLSAAVARAPCDTPALRPGQPGEALLRLESFSGGKRCELEFWADDRPEPGAILDLLLAADEVVRWLKSSASAGTKP